MDLSLTSTSLWKRLVAKLKVRRASPVRTTSWLLQRGAVLDLKKKRVRPDCLPEVSDEDERVWESQQGGKRSAMETLGFDVIVNGGWNRQGGRIY